jgi:hypothetical protein
MLELCYTVVTSLNVAEISDVSLFFAWTTVSLSEWVEVRASCDATVG